MMVDDDVRRVVCELHAELPRNGLVSWTSGNISARMGDLAQLVIKPSGVAFDDLRPEHMVVCDLDGVPSPGQMKPSSDARTHAAIYRGLEWVGGIVHTHSPYATAWAAAGRPIPCVLTAAADEFGGPVPLGNFAPIGDDAIGNEVVRVLRQHRSPAVLMEGHGVFTVGRTPRDALKAAVMVEDVARTTLLASLLGELRTIPADIVDQLHRRYQEDYGQ